MKLPRKATEYSVSELKTLNELLLEMRKVAGANLRFIGEDIGVENLVIKFSSLSYPEYNFGVRDIKLDRSHNPLVYGWLTPGSIINVGTLNISSRAKDFLGQFVKWIDIVKQFDQLNVYDSSVDDDVNRIYESLKILDPNADVVRFDEEQQIGLTRYLTLIEANLNDLDNRYVEYIKHEIDEVQIAVASLPKNAVMRKFSRLFALVKKWGGNRYFKMVTDVFKKEVIKKGLYTGLDKFIELVEPYKDILPPG